MVRDMSRAKLMQIWVAAVDKSKAASGADPSYPAFRFAFQNLNENNHRAYWTLDVRQPEDGGTCGVIGADCVPPSHWAVRFASAST